MISTNRSVANNLHPGVKPTELDDWQGARVPIRLSKATANQQGVNWHLSPALLLYKWQTISLAVLLLGVGCRTVSGI